MTSLWRRHRTRVLVALGLLLAVVGVALTSAGMHTSTPLDPDNPGPDGARALAKVLTDQGVEVEVARGAQALAEAGVAAGTTVLVTSSDQLGPSTADDLIALSAQAEVVVANPVPAIADLLGIGQPSRAPLSRPVPADCTDPRFEGLEVQADRPWSVPGSGCFPTGTGVLLALADDRLTLLGAGDLLTNEQIVLADNAAVALRLLGGEPRLVWYVPDSTDLLGEDSFSLGSVLPRWLAPGLWVVALACVGLVLWRVRRLGPLATEPLPVSVKAIESTQSRGRLYRRAGDRGHAAQTLREATRRRLAEQLQLGSPDAPALVRAVADHLGVPHEPVAELLDTQGQPPASDADLVALATRLSTLEEEVRRR